jgi:hypothetical protein
MPNYFERVNKMQIFSYTILKNRVIPKSSWFLCVKLIKLTERITLLPYYILVCRLLGKTLALYIYSTDILILKLIHHVKNTYIEINKNRMFVSETYKTYIPA